MVIHFFPLCKGCFPFQQLPQELNIRNTYSIHWQTAYLIDNNLPDCRYTVCSSERITTVKVCEHKSISCCSAAFFVITATLFFNQHKIKNHSPVTAKVQTERTILHAINPNPCVFSLHLTGQCHDGWLCNSHCNRINNFEVNLQK